MYESSSTTYKCHRCGNWYTRSEMEHHICILPSIKIGHIEPLIGPGAKDTNEYYRELHAPPCGSDARKIFDYACPPKVVFGFGGGVIKVN